MSEAYSRLYHRFAQEFPEIYADDHALASWVRLLMLADASWPMRPPLPRSVRPKEVSRLSEAGLLIVAGDTYTVRGLDAERTRRGDAARKGAVQRWQSARNAIADANAMPRRDETRRDETRRDEQDARADLDAFLSVRFRVPTPAQRTFMDGYCRTFDATGPERAARLILSHPDDPIGALKEDLAEFRSERRREAAASEAPKPRPRRGVLDPETQRIARLMREQDEQREQERIDRMLAVREAVAS